MVLLARQLRMQLQTAVGSSSGSTNNTAEEWNEVEQLEIDVGVTKKPYFVDKAGAIDESGVYASSGGGGVGGDGKGLDGKEKEFEQVHLVGFDTLIRIFDAKYYDPSEGLNALAPFLARHRVRAVVRPGGSGKLDLGKGERRDEEGQRGWLERKAKEGGGVRREWLERVEVVGGGGGGDDGEGGGEEMEGVSSSRVREAVGRGEWGEVQGLVGGEVEGWVRERGLYVGREGDGGEKL